MFQTLQLKRQNILKQTNSDKFKGFRLKTNLNSNNFYSTFTTKFKQETEEKKPKKAAPKKAAKKKTAKKKTTSKKAVRKKAAATKATAAAT